MRSARLFKNGQSQAVRLPKEFAFAGDAVYVQRLGRGVLLLPQDAGWDAVEAALAGFSADFGAERAQPPVQEREAL